MKLRSLYAALYELLSRLTENEHNTTEQELGEHALQEMQCLMDRLETALDPLADETPTKVHRSITVERCMELARSRECDCTNPGICIACGEDQDGFEPDAEKGKCEQCGNNTVYGPEELVMQGLVR